VIAAVYGALLTGFRVWTQKLLLERTAEVVANGDTNDFDVSAMAQDLAGYIHVLQHA
jgi:hypothetical protein